jgi:hypothetical protein
MRGSIFREGAAMTPSDESINSMMGADPRPAEKSELEPFEVRAEKMLDRVFRGIYHVSSLKKEKRHWTCITNHISTFDFDEMTRLVLGAHEYCLRVDIGNGGPHRLKVFISPREREGLVYDRHPTIEQAIQKWNNHER